MTARRRRDAIRAPSTPTGRGRSARSSLPEVPPAGTDWITNIATLVIVGAAIALVAYVRLRLADVPLERDEGEYAYAGQLILEGTPPYALAYNMKFPGAYYAYAALMSVFGQTPWGIRVGLLLVHVTTMVLVFVMGRRLIGTLGAGVGAAAFALLALDRWSMGIFAHATHFVLLPAMAGMLFLHSAIRGGRAWTFVAAGLCMGGAIVMKQQALFFAVMAVGLAVWSGRPRAVTGAGSAWRRGGLVVAGLVAAFAALVGVLAVEGVLGRFWFWTFQYGAAYVSRTPLSMAPTMLGMAWGYITQATGWLWYAAIAGAAIVTLTRWVGQSRAFLMAWLIAAALTVTPGWFFRPHYFILLMPIAGLLVGVLITSIDRLLSGPLGRTPARAVALLAFAGIVAVGVNRDSHFLFRMNETELMRAVYHANPFLESPAIARYLAANTTPDDRIAVLGSEPQIFFYANRKAATGYIYMYSLTEPQPYLRQMQDEMIREVEAARPKYLIYVGMSASWSASPAADRRLLGWANAYAAQCYDRVGLVDIDVARGSTIVWDADVARYQPRSTSLVLTYRRKTTADCAG